VLSDPFSERDFINFINEFLPNFISDIRKIDPGKSGFHEVTRLGKSSELRTEVLVIRGWTSIKNRISLTNTSFRILKAHSIFRALVVYVNNDETIWRLSLLTATPQFSQDGRVVLTLSNPKRHSYVLGTDVGIATARKYLSVKGRVKSIEDLEFRFSVEAVNRDFYSEIAEHFYRLIGRYGTDGRTLQEPLLKLPGESSKIEYLQAFSVRLLGRIIFLWFLKQKSSKHGQALLPEELIHVTTVEDEAFLHSKLEPIFFEVLNKPFEIREQQFAEGLYGQVPYLNGGLFHPIEGASGDFYSQKGKDQKVQIPNEWFEGVFKTLNTYNFTIDENIEMDVDLSIDPEMLGRVFENLLAEIDPETGESARRTTGSFYTPRKIVSHMTDLSLKTFLRAKTGVAEVKLDALISVDTLDDIQNPLNDLEKSQISDALYSLRSLDPACGSGAFPMGLLQKLVFILDQVDKDFKTGQKLFPKGYFKDKEHLKLNISYLRKLVLIRDVIHGVDIQPIAVEISKLRSFLTLVVEQEVFDELPNRGLEPLPNLDFQFICANSLIGLSDDQQLDNWEDSQLESELENIRQSYYSTKSQRKRSELKKDYADLVNQELSLFGESKRASQLKSFQPFAANSQATFFDSKSMFGIPDFDIVIGNPPYVKTEHLSEGDKSDLYENYFEIRDGKEKNWVDDLYVHFIFRAFDLVGRDGIVCFITNDSFIGLASKVRVRRKLLDENLLELISCPKETFGATIYTAIFLATKSKNSDPNLWASKFLFPTFDLQNRCRVSKSYIKALPKERFVFQEDQLIAKLLEHRSLGEFVRVIDTGIHSGNVRDKIFSLTKTRTINKRLIQGKQVVRWAVFWDSPNAKFKYCDPEYVPQDVSGIGRGGKKSSLKEYWGFAGDVSNHFLPERVLLRQTGDSLHAAFHSEVEDGHLYTDNTLFTVVLRDESVGSLKYFLGLMNSKVLNYVYQFLSSEEGKTLAQVKTGLVEQLPAIYDAEREEEVVMIVNALIEARRLEPDGDVSEIEKNLDELFCDIYNLTEDERGMIFKN
jgi:adenine-specific DNA-methyltransferase